MSRRSIILTTACLTFFTAFVGIGEALAQRTPPAPPPLTRLLATFVSAQAGFDTGVSVANTGRDHTGDVGQPGRCTIYYFGSVAGGGAAPPPQTTNADIPPGGQLTFVLSSGGGFGITGTPGFQGYLEIVCAFDFAHGFAFMTDGPIGQAKVAASPPVIVLPKIRSTVESQGQ